jgi:hypothetical protein
MDWYERNRLRALWRQPVALNTHVHQGLHGEGFVFALACAAGLNTTKTVLDVEGVDWQVGYPGPRGTVRHPKIEFQVKSWSEPIVKGDHFRYRLDVHTVRIFPAETSPGLIGLDDGVRAFESLRALVVAGAYAASAEQPRAVQPARKPNDVLNLLREIRVGPSREGSFVLSAHTPVPPRLTSGEAPPLEGSAPTNAAADEPFERRVSLRIYEAVQAASEAANSALVHANGLDDFTGAVRRGVSANLCEALVGLGGELGHPFELSLSLAVSRPLATRRFPPVRFRRDHFPVLTSAALGLRERVAEEGVLVAGNVVRLHREGAGSGEISIAGTVEGEDRLRRIWMALIDRDYDEAMRAHREMLPVSARGDLVQRGTRLYMRNPTAFRSLDAAD